MGSDILRDQMPWRLLLVHISWGAFWFLVSCTTCTPTLAVPLSTDQWYFRLLIFCKIKQKAYNNMHNL